MDVAKVTIDKQKLEYKKLSLDKATQLRKERIVEVINSQPIGTKFSVQGLSKAIGSTWATTKRVLDMMVTDVQIVFDKNTNAYVLPADKTTKLEAPVEPVVAVVEAPKLNLQEVANAYIAEQNIRMEDLDKLNFLNDFIKFADK